MEQNEKIEKPAWVEEIDMLLPCARQNVGTICASVIQNLGCIYAVSPALYDAVIDAVNKEIYENVEKGASEFVDEIVKDASAS